MPEIFLISDTHLGHANILKFQHNGNPLRPFKSLTEMHVTIVENWNKTVGPRDKVYHLGDVAMNAEGLQLLGMMNGKKRLVRGNHDNQKLNAYRQYFQEVYGVRQLDGYWMTHIPMHECSTSEQRCKGNFHGHLHAHPPPSRKHFNVSVERINYTPIPFDVAKEKINERV